MVVKGKMKLAKLLLEIWVVVGTVNLCFSLFAPFLPIEMDKKGYNANFMGPIMSIYSIGPLISSPIFPRAIKYFGRR